MKLFALGLLVLATSSYGVDVKKVTTTSAYTQDYVCQKGTRKNVYRVAYRDQEGEPPCKVYEVKNDKTRKIGESQRTLGVCESIMERVLSKLEAAGMDCDFLNND